MEEGQRIQGIIDFAAIFAKFALKVLRYGNIGFKKNKGYVQYNVVGWSIVSMETLIKNGVYDLSMDPKPSTLLTPKDYLALLKDYRDLQS